MVRKSGINSPVEGKVVEFPLFAKVLIHPRWLFEISETINQLSVLGPAETLSSQWLFLFLFFASFPLMPLSFGDDAM